MRKAGLTSEWLKDFIKGKGDAMTIRIGYVIKG
jgi:hypothetical protein